MAPLSFPALPTFVHEQEHVRAVPLCQHNSLTLTVAQPSQAWVRWRRNSFNL